MSEYIVDFKLDAQGGEYSYKRKDKIVRCRDCKHYNNQELDGEIGVCNLFLEGLDFILIVEPDGFCAWGERCINDI